MITFAEIAIGTLVIALLLVAAVATLRVTEKGTVKQKQYQQALDLSKQQAEEIKSSLSTQPWNNMKVDVRFPPAGTPSYGSYPPTTITMGRNKFIVDAEVRYIYSASTTQLAYIATPGTVATPETGEMVRVRVDSYYGPLAEWVPLPTVEASGNLPQNRMVYSNILADKTIYVGGTGSVWGYVLRNCSSGSPVTDVNVDVGLFQGATKIADDLPNSSGYYIFQDVPAGLLNIKIVSAPGYGSMGECNFSNPVTLTAGNSVGNANMGVTAIPVWNYYGVVVQTTPVVTTVPPTSPTPTPNPTAVFNAAPVTGAIVFADDGNSQPTTSVAGGAYTITQVRITPVAGHTFDTIEGDWVTATPVMGMNYNMGTTLYTPQTILGKVYMGPITVYLNGPLAGTIPVTFVVLDETYSTVSPAHGVYPITVLVADGSFSPPSGTLPNNAVNQLILNVHPGVANVQVSLKNNTAPIGFTTFNQTMTLDASVTAPVTLTNNAVGEMTGTVCGMGASFDYSQFKVIAQDDQGQFTYPIPVTYSAGATYGTFDFAYLRTPLGSPDFGQLNYSFIANARGDFTSTQEQQAAQQWVSQGLSNPIFVSLVNVYMNVLVNNNGTPYPYGSWVSGLYAARAPTPVPTPPPSLPVSMGVGSAVQNYYSSVTKGDGTANLQVQLSGGTTTMYSVYAQIVSSTSFAVTAKSQTVTMDTTNTFNNPKPVTFNFTVP